MEPLGIRNNNPLNIRRGKTRWKGELPQTPPPSGEAGRGTAFCKFERMEWGLRAAFCLLRTYRDKYKLNCIADIIMRWAPPSENRTAQYIRNVTVHPQRLPLDRLRRHAAPHGVRLANTRQGDGSTRNGSRARRERNPCRIPPLSRL